ncbi:MAG: hypothetical protein PHS53_00470 [Candidatus Pacebacteria bacterium]|nr:hypothetical protein [Candidatus Paceibacterota bacterium]MDD5356610.1 hypothetical protein [Candidatus Paceibacterota bacterium]
MPHMSLRRRRLYFYSFCLIFFVLIPVLVFYANGYRITKDWQVAETGGIYVYASESNADVSLNGVLLQKSGIFQRGTFLDGLTEGKYEISVSKADFSSWKKDIEVKEGFVTEGHPFLIPLNIEPVLIPEFSTSTATSTKIKNPDYADALLLFQKSLVKKTLATTTLSYGEDALRNGNLVVFETGTQLQAVWLGDTNSMPYFFCHAVLCGTDTSATSTVYTNVVPKSHLEFLPRRTDVVLLETKEGIEAVELDTTFPQNAVLVYPTKTADFRVSNGVIYLKDGANISKINL